MLRKWTVISAVAAIVAGALAPAGAVTLGTKVLRGAAIGYAVKQTAGPLNEFINKVTLQRGMPSGLATKVVPIISVGEKGYIGGAQVSGPAALVKDVRAVLQYEQNFSTGNYRIKALVPSSSINPLELKRVPKVGVSALIDVALAGGLKTHTYGGGVGGGEIIRAAAVAVGVKAAAGALNKAINTITFDKGAVTAVVPMATFGEKAYIGGAQVSGSTRVIDAVEAVWQYEDLFSNGKFRVKILVPTNSTNPLKMKRVQGAGITAVIDTAIARQSESRDGYYYDGTRRVYRPDVSQYERDRHDRGLHKGWYIGKHKGWDKDKSEADVRIKVDDKAKGKDKTDIKIKIED